MWCDLDQLQEAAELSMDHPELGKLIKDWNDVKSWEDKDMLLCKIMNYVKDLKSSGNMTPQIVHLDEPLEETKVEDK